VVIVGSLTQDFFADGLHLVDVAKKSGRCSRGG
jgi:hypothetical protein